MLPVLAIQDYKIPTYSQVYTSLKDAESWKFEKGDQEGLKESDNNFKKMKQKLRKPNYVTPLTRARLFTFLESQKIFLLTSFSLKDVRSYGFLR